MKHILLLALVCIMAFSCQKNQNVNLIQTYIDKLNWSSYELTTSYIPDVILKEDATFLINNVNNKYKTDELIKNIATPNKTVVIHIILTRIFESKNAELVTQYVYQSDSTVSGVNFTYNNLTWHLDSNNNQHLSKKELEKIKNYWKNAKLFTE